LYFTVHNNGRGRGYSTQANLKNLSGQGVLLHAGRFHVDNMEPGGEQRVAFTFEVQPQFRENEVRLEVQIEDDDLREYVMQKIHIPIADALAVQPATGTWTAAADANGLESPNGDARTVAHVPAGTTANITAQIGDFVRLDVGDHHPLWVRRAEGTGRPAAQRPAIAWTLQNSPPQIESDAGDTLAVRGATHHITGTANDQQRVLDMYIFVGARKVFYRSNREGANQRLVQFAADLPLRPGANIVTIVAREDDDTLARRTFVIRRDGPGGELLQTPRAGTSEGEDD
ncbi:MAG: peptidase S41, partial [Deltaproteobacteria bacterium]